MTQAGATGEVQLGEAGPGVVRPGEEEQAMERVDRRAAAWPDFLRRMLLGASLASTAATLAALPDDNPPGEVAEAEAPGDPGIARVKQG
jgi:hypothetical protein